MSVITNNSKAYHDYFILKTFVAGIVLEGSEVKSIRQKETNLKDSFVVIDRKGEMYLKNAYIKPYDKSTSYTPDPRRSRKLLLHRAEIEKIASKVKEKGLTIVPIKMFFDKSHVKIEIGIAQGKHTYDKKRDLMERDKQMDLNRQLKNY